MLQTVNPNECIYTRSCRRTTWSSFSPSLFHFLSASCTTHELKILDITLGNPTVYFVYKNLLPLFFSPIIRPWLSFSDPRKYVDVVFVYSRSC